MKHHAVGNYLKSHRRKAGLSQKEISVLLGYEDPGQISRHEQSASIPPLHTALAYALIFRVPLSSIFVDLHGGIERQIEHELQKLETELRNRSAADRDANLTAQKLIWLNERRSR